MYNFLTGIVLNTTDAKTVEDEIRGLKEYYGNLYEKTYKRLLAREIEELTDNIVLNILHLNDDNDTIFAAAKRELDAKIEDASRKGLETEYCFSLSAYIMYNEDFTKTYIQVKEPTGLYSFSEFAGDKEYSLSKEDETLQTQKFIDWKKVTDRYQDNTPSAVRIFFGYSATPEFEELTFRCKEERCEERAFDDYVAKYMKQYANNGAIPDFRTREVIRLAQERPDVKGEVQANYEVLITILPDITKEVVTGIE